MAYSATYINASQFSVPGDVLAELRIGTRIACDQGVDGVYIDDITVALYDAGEDETVITVETGDLTANLTSVLRGPTFVDDSAHESNLSQHDHSSAWQGGNLPFGLFTDADIVARLISWGGISPSVANFILGVNSAGTGVEKKAVAGTTNQVTVTHAANLITLSTPQNIHTAATPTFAGLTLSALTGLLFADANGLLTHLVASAANQVPRWNVANNAWEMVNFSLANMKDVSIDTPTDGQSLIYSAGNWINAMGSGGSGGVSLATVMGLITALGGAPDEEGAEAVHAAEHIAGGGDIIDADQLEVSYVPTNYTPVDVAETSAADQLAAHLAGLEAQLLVPDPSQYCPSPFYVSSTTQITLRAGTYYFEGYRHGRKYERRNTRTRVIGADTAITVSSYLQGGLVNSSWYSVFLKNTAQIIMPFIRVKAVTLDGGNTKIEIGQQDDHTTAEDGFLTVNDGFNANRLIKWSVDAYNGSIYTIADSVNQVGDYLVITGDKTTEIAAGDWLQLVPVTETDVDTAFVYLGVIRIDDVGSVVGCSRERGGWDYSYAAPAYVDGNLSAAPDNTLVSPGVPPNAKIADLEVAVDSGVANVNDVIADLYRGNDGTEIIYEPLLSTGTADVKSMTARIRWQMSYPSLIRNALSQDGGAASSGGFYFAGFSE